MDIFCETKNFTLHVEPESLHKRIRKAVFVSRIFLLNKTSKTADIGRCQLKVSYPTTTSIVVFRTTTCNTLKTTTVASYDYKRKKVAEKCEFYSVGFGRCLALFTSVYEIFRWILN